jgi:hypothetical protein
VLSWTKTSAPASIARTSARPENPEVERDPNATFLSFAARAAVIAITGADGIEGLGRERLVSLQLPVARLSFALWGKAIAAAREPDRWDSLVADALARRNWAGQRMRWSQRFGQRR